MKQKKSHLSCNMQHKTLQCSVSHSVLHFVLGQCPHSQNVFIECKENYH